MGISTFNNEGETHWNISKKLLELLDWFSLTIIQGEIRQVPIQMVYVDIEEVHAYKYLQVKLQEWL